MTKISKKAESYYRNKGNSCKSRGIAFELTKKQVQEFLQIQYCAYTGVKLTRSTASKQRATDWTLERVDCTKPYTLENTIVVCHAANAAKSAFETIYRDKAAEVITKMSKYFEKPRKDYNMVQKAVLWLNGKVGL